MAKQNRLASDVRSSNVRGKRRDRARKWVALAAAAGLMGQYAPAFAAVQYWDINGVTPGAGGAAPAGAWSGSFWSPNADGDAATLTWTGGNDAVFSAGNDAIGAFTVDLGTTGQSVKNLLVEEGQLTIGGTTGAFTLSSGATWGASSGATLLADRAINAGANLFTIDTTGAVTLTGIISGTGGLTKNGSGTLTLRGATAGSAVANTFTGNITLNGGVLEVNQGNAASTSLGGQTATTYRQIFFNNNATLRTTATWNNNVPSATNAAFVFNFTGAGTLDVAAGATLTLDDGAAVGTGAGNAQLQGSGTLTKIGAGTLSLGNGSSNFSNFTGAIVINAGVLQLGTGTNGGTNPLGATTVGTTIASGAGFNVNGTNNTAAEPLTISGMGANAADGALYSSTGNGSFAGPIALADATTIGGSGNLTLTGVVSGSTFITKVGAGQLTLSAANTYGGGTQISGGTLLANHNTALAGGSVIVATGGTLRVNNGINLSAGPISLDGGTLSSLGANATIVTDVTGGSIAHTISPGGALANGILNIGILSTNANTTLAFDAASPGTTNDVLNVTGADNFFVDAGTKIAFNLANPTIAGNYRLMGYNGTAPTLSNFVLPDVPSPRVTYNLSTGVEAGYINLVVGNSGVITTSWQGAGAGPNSWNTAGNWTGGVVPGISGDTANFVSSAAATNQIVNLDGEQHVGTLVFNNTTTPTPGNYTLAPGAGGVLVLDNGASVATVTNTAGNNTISAPVALASDASFSAASGRTLTLAGVVSGTTNVTVPASNAGTITFSAANTFSGGTTVAGGTLVLSNANSYAGGTTVSGGTLSVDNNAALGSGTLNLLGGGIQSATVARTVPNAVTINGDFAFAGTAAANNLTLGGATALNAPATITVSNAAVTGTISGVVSGAAANTLTKAGPGALTLTAANTFTGNVNVTGGTLAFSNATSLGAGAKTVTLTNGGTLGVNVNYDPGVGTASLVVGTGGGTFNVNSGNTLTLNDAGQFSGAGNVTKSGAGTWILGQAGTPPTYSFTGAYTVSTGTLQALNTAALGTPTGYTVASGAAFDLRATTPNNAPWTINGTGIGSGGALIAGGAAGVVTGPVTLAGNSSVGGAGALTLSGGVTGGAVTLTKIGAGTLTLAGAGTYTGVTTLSAGTLVAAANGALGTGNVALNAGTFATAPNTTITLNNIVTAGSAAHTFAPGGVGGVGAVGINGLTTSNLMTLNFDLVGPGIATFNDFIDVNGTLTAGANTPITFNANPAAAGSYRLIGFDGTAPTLGNFVLPAAPNARTSYTLAVNDPGFIDLVVSVTGGQSNAAWIPGATGRSWNDGANWTGGVVPTIAGDTASFTTSSATPEAVNLNAQHHVASVTFANPGAGVYTIAAGTGTGTALFLDNGAGTATVTNSTNNNVISAPVNLYSDTEVTAAAGTNLTISGVVSGFKPLTVPAAHAGTLTLSGTNTFTGGLVIKGGVVQITADAHLGSTASVTTLDGGTLTTNATFNLAAGRVINVAPAGGTINNLGAGTTGKLATAGAGQLTGTGPLTKSGGAVFQFVADNLGYSGNFIVAGLVEQSSPRALGTGLITVNAGGELAIGNSTVTPNSFTLNGGTITAQSNNNAGISGPVNVASNSTIALRDFNTPANARSFTISGPLSGAGNLGFIVSTSTGNNAQSLTLSGDNSAWTGAVNTSTATNVNGIAVRLGSPTALGSTSVGTTIGTFAYLDLNGVDYTSPEPLTVGGNGPTQFPTAIANTAVGTTAAFAGPITLAANTVIGNNTVAPFTLSGDIGESGGARKLTMGHGNVATLSGNNTFTGGVELLLGTLAVSSNANLGDTAGTLTFNGGTLRVNGTTLNNLGSRPVVYTTNKNVVVEVTEASHTFTLTNPMSIGTGDLVKSGPGTLGLTGANTVRVLRMGGGTLQLDEAATLYLNNGGGDTLRATADSLITGGTITIGMSGTTGTNFGDNSVSNGVTLTIASKLTALAGATNGFEYCCDDPGGTIMLTNMGNDFPGVIQMNRAGTIGAPAIKNSGENGPLGRGGQIVFAGLNGALGARLLHTGPGETTNRTLVLGQTQAIVDASGTSTLETPLKFTSNLSITNTGAKTLTLQGTAVGEIAGVIGNNTNPTSVVKAGSGTWALSGANTYTGTTTVNAGTLLAMTASGSATGSGAVTVNTGGTLGGTGRVAGPVTITSGGTLSPGLSPGVLMTGALTLNAGGTLVAELAGVLPGEYDQVDVTGAVALGGSTLSVVELAQPSIGDTYTIILNDGADAVTGTFAGYAQGATVTTPFNQYSISYVAGTGNDVVLTALTSNPIPEPAAFGLLGFAAAGLLARRRRRQA